MHFLYLLIFTKRIIKLNAALLFVVYGCIELGGFLREALVCWSVFQVFCDEILVDDMALKLSGRDNVAVSELEMLNEKTGAIECLLTSDAGELLVNTVALKFVSDSVYRGDNRLRARYGGASLNQT